MYLKTVFLSEFPPFLDSTIRIVTYIIQYLVLLYWSTFQAHLSPFWGVMAKKRPKISLKSYFLLLPKHLKFENSGTKNHTCIKLGPDMYHLNTFLLPRNGGVNQWVWGGDAYKKPPKNAIKLPQSPL